MTSENFDVLAARIASVPGAPGIPTILHVRKTGAYEVDFEALDFEVDEALGLADEASLALVDALGRASAEDLRCYLGLQDVAELCAAHLIDEGLVGELQSPGFWGSASPSRRPTQAHRLANVQDSGTPRLVLTEVGRRALEVGVRRHVVTRPVTLVLLADPLHFVRVHCEASTRFAPAHRELVLHAKAVPVPFRNLDEVLGDAPGSRERSVGIGENLGELEGRFLGVRDGSRWEVRKKGGPNLLLVIAGFYLEGRFVWRTYLGREADLEECERLRPETLVPEGLLGSQVIDRALQELGYDLSLANSTSSCAPLVVLADEDTIADLLGSTEDPTDRWLNGTMQSNGWATGLRVRALPQDEASAHVAVVALLARRERALRGGLDTALALAHADLEAFWGGVPFAAPLRERVLQELWVRYRKLRLLCEERMKGDLVTPYLAEGNAR